MKRIRVVAIWHVADSADEKHLAGLIADHMGQFCIPDEAVNARRPHHESLEIAVERSRWEPAEKRK